MKFRKYTFRATAFIVLLSAILMLSGSTGLVRAQGSASVWTDKDDYAPGETVAIFGSGFEASADVTVNVERPDGVVDTINTVTNETGFFLCTYQLDGIPGIYTVTATDGTNTATTTFTDRKWFVSVSPTGATVPQGGSTTATVSVTAKPDGGPEVDLWAEGQPAGVTVTFSPHEGIANFTSTMSVNVGSTVPPGTYLINITVFTGVPGHPSYSEKARTNFTLTVTGTPPQTVSITITSSPVTGEGFIKVDDTAITTPATFTWTVGSTHTLEALSPVSGSTGIRYVWTSWSDGGGQTHDYTVPNSDETVTAYYKTQYNVIFTQSGVGTDFTGTVMMVDGVNYDRNGHSDWYDSGASVSFSYSSPLVVTTGSKQYVLTGVDATSPLAVSGPTTVTGSYKTQYYLTVDTNPGEVLTLNPSAVSGGGWYDAGETATVDAVQNVDKVAGESRYDFRSWTGATPKGTDNQAEVLMDSPKTATANYQLQYNVTITQTGLDDTATGTVVTIGSVIKTKADLPFTDWLDSGTTYSYSSIVSSSITDKRFRLESVTGPTSPITSSGTVTGNYVPQYKVTFTQSGLDGTASGTVVTVSGTPKTYGDLPFTTDWLDHGSSLTFEYSNIVDSSVSGKRFKLVSASHTSPLTVTAPTTLTGTYKTQYLLTVQTDPPGLTPQPTRSPTGEAGSADSWWYDASTSVTLTAQPIEGYTFSYWSVDDVSQGSGVNPVTVNMDGPHNATAHYGIPPAEATVTFSQVGVGTDFTGTVLTVDGTGYGLSDLPKSFTWTICSNHTFTYHSPLLVDSGKRYVWENTSGLSTMQSGTIHVESGGGEVTAYYKTQYLVSFEQTGSAVAPTVTYTADTDPTGVVPFTIWVKAGSEISYIYQDNVDGAPGVRYVLVSVSPASPQTVTNPLTITGTYKTQYRVRIEWSGLGSDATGKVVTVTVGGTPNIKNAGDSPFDTFIDSGTTLSYSYEDVVSSTATGKRYKLDSVSGTSTAASHDFGAITEPITETGNYKTQYRIDFSQSGIGTDYNNVVLTVDGVNYKRTELPQSFWWDDGSTHSFKWHTPLIASSTKQYGWYKTTGLSDKREDTSFTVSGPGTITSYYRKEKPSTAPPSSGGGYKTIRRYLGR